MSLSYSESFHVFWFLPRRFILNVIHELTSAITSGPFSAPRVPARCLFLPNFRLSLYMFPYISIAFLSICKCLTPIYFLRPSSNLVSPQSLSWFSRLKQSPFSALKAFNTFSCHFNSLYSSCIGTHLSLPLRLHPLQFYKQDPSFMMPHRILCIFYVSYEKCDN